MQPNYNNQLINPQVIQHQDGSSHFVGEVCPNGLCDGYGNPVQLSPFSQGMLPSAEQITNNYSTDNVRWLQAMADSAEFGVKFNNANEINQYYDAQAIDRMRRSPEWNDVYNLGVDQFGNEGAGLIADQRISTQRGLGDSMYNLGQTTTNANKARELIYSQNAIADTLDSDEFNTSRRLAAGTGTPAVTPFTDNAGRILGLTNGLNAKIFSPNPVEEVSERLLMFADPAKAVLAINKDNFSAYKAGIAPTIRAGSSEVIARLNAAKAMAIERRKADDKEAQNRLKNDLDYKKLVQKQQADANKGSSGSSNLYSSSRKL